MSSYQEYQRLAVLPVEPDPAVVRLGVQAQVVELVNRAVGCVDGDADAFQDISGPTRAPAHEALSALFSRPTHHKVGTKPRRAG
ncbi:hypothetical protein GCM10010270_85380 [Streptomyces violaceus]|nr:hypothetical protein GCM10010270_85380 [Streptomyces janthinus]